MYCKPLIAEDKETQAIQRKCPVSVPCVTSSYPVEAAPFFLSISPASRQSDQFFGMARLRRPPDPYLAQPVAQRARTKDIQGPQGMESLTVSLLRAFRENSQKALSWLYHIYVGWLLFIFSSGITPSKMITTDPQPSDPAFVPQLMVSRRLAFPEMKVRMQLVSDNSADTLRIICFIYI